MPSRRGIAGFRRFSLASSAALVATLAIFSVATVAVASGSAQTRHVLMPAINAAIPFTASATDNIFGAGLTTAPDPGGNGGGVVPLDMAVPVGTSTVTFSQVAGSVSFSPGS